MQTSSTWTTTPRPAGRGRAGGDAPLLREQFGNPASGHVLGRAARDAVERSRQAVAGLIGARRASIVFTASATEANNLAIAGLTAGHAAGPATSSPR